MFEPLHKNRNVQSSNPVHLVNFFFAIGTEISKVSEMDETSLKKSREETEV